MNKFLGYSHQPLIFLVVVKYFNFCDQLSYILGKNTKFWNIEDSGFFWFFSAGIYLAKQWVLDLNTSCSRGKKWIPNCRKVNKISFLHTAMCHNCTGLAWLQDSSQKKNQLSTYYYCEKGCRMLGLFFGVFSCSIYGI